MYGDNVWCPKHKRSSVKIVPLSWQQREFIPKHKMWCGWGMDELWSMPSLSHPTVAHTKATPRKLMKKKGSGVFGSLSIRNPVFRWHRQQTRWHRQLHCLMLHSGFCNDNYDFLLKTRRIHHLIKTLQCLSDATFFDKLCKVVPSSYVWLVSLRVFSTNFYYYYYYYVDLCFMGRLFECRIVWIIF